MLPLKSMAQHSSDRTIPSSVWNDQKLCIEFVADRRLSLTGLGKENEGVSLTPYSENLDISIPSLGLGIFVYYGGVVLRRC
jgi:hypothetical protein